MAEITITTEQILNLCKFAGIEVDKERSAYSGDEEYLLETEYTIAQNKFGAVAWLTEYPEEGVYPLSDHTEAAVKRTTPSGES